MLDRDFVNYQNLAVIYICSGDSSASADNLLKICDKIINKNNRGDEIGVNYRVNSLLECKFPFTRRGIYLKS